MQEHSTSEEIKEVSTNITDACEHPRHLRQVKFEVELPCGVAGRCLAVLVHERQAQLDDAQQVDVAAQHLVLVVGRRAKLTDRLGHDAGELGVHGHIVVLGDDLAYGAELLLDVALPHVADAAVLVVRYVARAVLRPVQTPTADCRRHVLCCVVLCVGLVNAQALTLGTMAAMMEEGWGWATYFKR